MKHLSLLLLYTLVSFCSHTGVFSQAPTYGERGSDLGIQVFQQVVRSKPQENVVFSPHGVASILGMLLPGAHGDTRKQLLNGLRYKKNGPYRMLKKLHKALTAKSNQDAVLIANAMFTQQGFPMESTFVATNKDNFQCESRSLDFSNPDGAAGEINAWVNNKTKGHISSLIKPDMLNDLTRLVAVNSIYFKGLWKSRFQPKNTKMGPFTGGDGTVYKVPMMSQLSVFNMGVVTTSQGLKYEVIELPYHGGSISMLIVLPSEEDTPLSRVIPHISTATVHSWTSLMVARKVHLSIPKFTVDAEVDLEDPLSALGITDMFNQAKADFRHISAAEQLYVSRALQKAKIIVNEDGTKAAAATTAILMARSSPPWVTVDRPFLFLIRHKPTGTILFMGQINQPASRAS
ncbi:glia-derived nexin [Halichoeres trimaculatus]|uniref:glia-derived nexin n=1 Tax=Halichoeres trimaculatus TaxID=147232 RepID=UPI003D9ECDC0